MSNLQLLEIYAGANTTLTLYARDSSNNPQVLWGGDLVWRVGNPPWDPDYVGPVLEIDGTVIDGDAGSYSVDVTPTDSRKMPGNYLYTTVATRIGHLQFVNDDGDDLNFINNDGEELFFLNDTNTGTQVVTTGILRIRAT